MLFHSKVLSSEKEITSTVGKEQKFHECLLLAKNCARFFHRPNLNSQNNTMRQVLLYSFNGEGTETWGWG